MPGPPLRRVVKAVEGLNFGPSVGREAKGVTERHRKRPAAPGGILGAKAGTFSPILIEVDGRARQAYKTAIMHNTPRPDGTIDRPKSPLLDPDALLSVLAVRKRPHAVATRLQSKRMDAADITIVLDTFRKGLGAHPRLVAALERAVPAVRKLDTTVLVSLFVQFCQANGSRSIVSMLYYELRLRREKGKKTDLPYDDCLALLKAGLAHPQFKGDVSYLEELFWFLPIKRKITDAQRIDILAVLAEEVGKKVAGRLWEMVFSGDRPARFVLEFADLGLLDVGERVRLVDAVGRLFGTKALGLNTPRELAFFLDNSLFGDVTSPLDAAGLSALLSAYRFMLLHKDTLRAIPETVVHLASQSLRHIIAEHSASNTRRPPFSYEEALVLLKTLHLYAAKLDETPRIVTHIAACVVFHSRKEGNAKSNISLAAELVEVLCCLPVIGVAIRECLVDVVRNSQILVRLAEVLPMEVPPEGGSEVPGLLAGVVWFGGFVPGAWREVFPEVLLGVVERPVWLQQCSYRDARLCAVVYLRQHITYEIARELRMAASVHVDSIQDVEEALLWLVPVAKLKIRPREAVAERCVEIANRIDFEDTSEEKESPGNCAALLWVLRRTGLLQRAAHFAEGVLPYIKATGVDGRDYVEKRVLEGAGFVWKNDVSAR